MEEIAGWGRVTVGADQGYDRKAFIQELRDHQVTPHIARKPTSILDARTTRHPGYAISQKKRKRIEEIFGWLKTVAGLRKTRHRGVARVQWMFTFAWRSTTWSECATCCPLPHETASEVCPVSAKQQAAGGLRLTKSPSPRFENLKPKEHIIVDRAFSLPC